MKLYHFPQTIFCTYYTKISASSSTIGSMRITRHLIFFVCVATGLLNAASVRDHSSDVSPRRSVFIEQGSYNLKEKRNILNHPGYYSDAESEKADDLTKIGRTDRKWNLEDFNIAPYQMSPTSRTIKSSAEKVLILIPTSDDDYSMYGKAPPSISSNSQLEYEYIPVLISDDGHVMQYPSDHLNTYPIQKETLNEYLGTRQKSAPPTSTVYKEGDQVHIMMQSPLPAYKNPYGHHREPVSVLNIVKIESIDFNKKKHVSQPDCSEEKSQPGQMAAPVSYAHAAVPAPAPTPAPAPIPAPEIKPSMSYTYATVPAPTPAPTPEVKAPLRYVHTAVPAPTPAHVPTPGPATVPAPEVKAPMSYAHAVVSSPEPAPVPAPVPTSVTAHVPAPEVKAPISYVHVVAPAPDPTTTPSPAPVPPPEFKPSMSYTPAAAPSPAPAPAPVPAPAPTPAPVPEPSPEIKASQGYVHTAVPASPLTVPASEVKTTAPSVVSPPEPAPVPTAAVAHVLAPEVKAPISYAHVAAPAPIAAPAPVPAPEIKPLMSYNHASVLTPGPAPASAPEVKAPISYAHATVSAQAPAPATAPTPTPEPVPTHEVKAAMSYAHTPFAAPAATPATAPETKTEMIFSHAVVPTPAPVSETKTSMIHSYAAVHAPTPAPAAAPVPVPQSVSTMSYQHAASVPFPVFSIVPAPEIQTPMSHTHSMPPASSIEGYYSIPPALTPVAPHSDSSSMGYYSIPPAPTPVAPAPTPVAPAPAPIRPYMPPPTAALHSVPTYQVVSTTGRPYHFANPAPTPAASSSHPQPVQSVQPVSYNNNPPKQAMPNLGISKVNKDVTPANQSPSSYPTVETNVPNAVINGKDPSKPSPSKSEKLKEYFKTLVKKNAEASTPPKPKYMPPLPRYRPNRARGMRRGRTNRLPITARKYRDAKNEYSSLYVPNQETVIARRK